MSYLDSENNPEAYYIDRSGQRLPGVYPCSPGDLGYGFHNGIVSVYVQSKEDDLWHEAAMDEDGSMTIEQKRKVLERIVALQRDIETLKQVRVDLAASGYASATMSSGGGSKSYTRLDIGKVTEAIGELVCELKSLRSLLNGNATLVPKKILTVYL